VALTGEVKGEDKLAFLTGADLFVFPSHSENFGLACLEALAAGLPVVASRSTPWSEVAQYGAGVWVDNTPNAFAESIIELLSRDGEGKRRKARDVAARYDLATVAISLRRIYGELFDANR
jgi:glycosyltransferase involved in cell wall biosynthesis